MKSNRRTLMKGLVASVAGAAGVGLAGRASAKAAAPATHESIGVVRHQNIPAYSESTKYGNLVFISGMGCHEGPATIEHHTEVVMKELKKAIEAAGSSMDKVLECYAYVDDAANYDGMNKVYDGFWPKMPTSKLFRNSSTMGYSTRNATMPSASVKPTSAASRRKRSRQGRLARLGLRL